MNSVAITIGALSGAVTSEFNNPLILENLANLPQLYQRGAKLSHGGDFVVKSEFSTVHGNIPVAIKVFKRQSWWKDHYDKKNKSKAERSYLAACYLQEKNIGTPAAIAWLERWENNRLLESYYICRYEAAPSFREVVAEILWDKRDNEPMMEILHHLAPAVRAMHDAGFMHGDMGNQNILLSRSADGEWQAPQFIDLNRSKIFTAPLGNKERAKDLARIALPGAYMKIFKMIYSHHQYPEAELDKLEQKLRDQFWRHRRNSKWRHPIRHWKNSRKASGRPLYPSLKDIWLWDEKSAQPMISLGRKEKHQQRNTRYMLSMLWQGICALPGIYSIYRKLLTKSYSQPVALHKRIGVALHPHSHYIETELQLLKQLGNPPVLIRFCHHESEADWQRGIALVEQLHRQGIEVMLAILQDRRALLYPESWANFLSLIVRKLADKTSHIEITHASNRMKWGIWNSSEYVQLLQPALALKKQFPQIKITGPACIDFEYLPVVAALGALPKNTKLDALSHLLYVDRRGAPENKQGYFSTLEKSALLKALALWSPHTEEKVIISEVNWPVQHSGIWSPIGCPYETPNWRRDQPGENDADYANYMLRFLAITLCSGHVEQVFWWRLSAHGYGLVDDRNNFTPRPAFKALAFFLELIGTATFERKHFSDDDEYLLRFSKNGQQLLMAWRTSGTAVLASEFSIDQAWDAYGNSIATTEISESPTYYLLTSYK